MRLLSIRVAVCLALSPACATAQRPLPRAPSPPSPYVEKARPLFDGCASKSTGRGRTYDCGEVEAWMVELGQLDPANAMQLSVQALRSVMHEARAEQQVSEVTLGGRPWPSARISACADSRPGSCQVGQVVTVAAPDGGARLLGCAVRGAAPGAARRCQAMLELFATDGPPDGEPLAQPAPRPDRHPALLARPLKVPRGCRVAEYDGSSTGVLVCEDATSFYWSEAGPRSAAELESTRDAALEGVKKALGAAGKEKDRSVPCLISRVSTRCKVTEAKLPDGALQIVIGAVNVGKDRSLVAACNAVAPVSSFPPVCNGLLSLP